MKDVWGWLKGAPLPVVLGIMILLGAVGEFRISQTAAIADEANQKATDAQKTAEVIKVQVEKANEKLDRLLEAVLMLQAEQRAKEKAERKKR